jgi:carbamoyltransferase
MIILGIADNHDSGAALLVNGKLVGALNQERIDRVKNSSQFPWGAIDQLLQSHQISYAEIDRISIGTAFTPSAFLRANPKQHQRAKSNGQFSPLLHSYMLYQSSLRRSGLYTIEVDACHRILRTKLLERPFKNPDIRLLDHHEAHAQGAYRTQPRETCLVMTLDAMGDGLSSTVWRATDGELRKLWDQSGLAAINLFYSRITELLGFTPLKHEGKITGLAAYVSPPDELLRHFRGHVCFTKGKFKHIDPLTPAHRHDSFWAKTRDYSKQEVASAAQAILEECVLNFIRYWISKTGLKDLALAGGIFANVKLNQKIAELDEVQSIWIMPHMGDGGLSVGAALATADSPPTEIDSIYLGFEPSKDDIFRALKRNNLERQTENSLNRAADCLANGGVIARCSGKMEWGPRALGNRSIFATPEDPNINSTLNKRLDRTEFMPFAPIVRDIDAHRYFVGLDKCESATRFMTICLETTEEFQKNCPAAVHVDNTARPQILSKQDNPEVYQLLTAIGERTGVPVLINTSFNMHEEPIVCTADDAIRAWLSSGLEGLLIGEHFVQQTQT